MLDRIAEATRGLAGGGRAFGGRLRRAVRRRFDPIAARATHHFRERTFAMRVRRISGEKRAPATETEFTVVCLVRDGRAYLDEFLAHYRALGAREIVFLDNGSTDGTVERLTREPDVTVISTTAPYKIFKDAMKRYLVTRFSGSGWVLCVDIDELFDYPARETAPMDQLIRYLNESGYTAVVAHLLDMFPSGSIVEGSSASWRRDHRFYDLTALEGESYADYYEGWNHCSNSALKVFHGGIRSSKFSVRAFLSKHPLLRPSRGVYYDNAHDVRGARVADFSAVLLHYKYAGDFVNYAEKIVAEKSFWNGSQEYEAYLEAIGRDSGLRLHTDSSSEFIQVGDLVAQDFLVASPGLDRWMTARDAEGDRS